MARITGSFRRWSLLLLLLAGCSTAPVADLLDFFRPGRIAAGKAAPRGGVCGPQQPGPPVPAPDAAVLPPAGLPVGSAPGAIPPPAFPTVPVPPPPTGGLPPLP
jgi:hypothetical protein